MAEEEALEPKEQELWTSEDSPDPDALWTSGIAEESPLSASPVPTVKNEKVEQTISGMADAFDYSNVKSLSEHREMSLREDLATSVHYIKGLSTKEKADAFSVLLSPLTPRTTGEALSSSVSSPEHKQKDRSALADNTDATIGADILEEGYKKSLDIPAGKSAMRTPIPAATAVIAHLSGEDPVKESTLEDVLTYLNPIGMEEKDGVDIDFWGHVGDMFTLDFDSDKFDEDMTSNYGEDWGKRFTAWMAKEVSIDAAVLLAGILFPPVGAVLAFNKATKLARFGASVGRALWVGAGGTGAQWAQDQVIDRETNYGTEFLLRAGGEGVGELLAFGGKAAYTKVFGKGKNEVIKDIAEGTGNKMVSQNAVRKMLLSRRQRTSQVASLVEHKLIGDVKNYSKVMNELADQIIEGSAKGGMEEIAEEADIAVRDGLAKLMGKEVSELDDLNMDAIMPMVLKHGELLDTAKTVAMKNNEAIGHGVGYDLLGRYENAFNKMSDIYEYHITNNKLTFRESMKGAAKQLDNFVTKAMKGARIVESSNLVDQTAANWLATKNFNANMQRGFESMYKETLRGLNKTERETLFEVLASGDKKGVVYNFQKGEMPIGISADKLSKKVEVAYAKFRFMDDIAFEVHDANMTAALKNTVRVGTDGKYYQVAKTKSNGDVEAKVLNRAELTTGKNTKPFTAAEWKSLEAPDSVLQYKVGHLPQGYDKHRYSVVVFDAKTGAAAREAMFHNAKDAEAYRARRAAASKKNDTKEVVLQIMNDAGSGSSGVKYDKTTKDLLAGLDKDTKALLETRLAEAGVPIKDAGYIMHLNFNPVNARLATSRKSIPTVVTKQAQEKRLQLAEARQGPTATRSELIKQLKSSELREEQLLPSNQQYLNYLHRVSNASGNMYWRAHSSEYYFTKFGEYLLESAKDPISITKESFVDGTAQEIINAGVRHSKWLKRAVKERTVYEEWHDKTLNNVTQLLAQKAQTNKTAEIFSKALDHFPSATGMLQGARYFAAFPKLLTLNAAQIVVQGSQAVGTLGYAAVSRNPVQLISDISKIPVLGVIHAATRMGRKVPNNKMGKLYKEFIQSGYAADLATADTDFGMLHALNPSTFARSWSMAKGIGASPFRAGEAINRVTAFVTVREELARKILKGQEVIGIAGTPLRKSDIGTESFRHTVVDKAQVLALNMGKAGQLEATSGLGSVLLQFKQVLAKEVSLFNSAKLKGHEKLGVAAGLVGFFGVGAIPLSYDALRLADIALNDSMDPLGNIKATKVARQFAEHIGSLTSSATNGLVSSKAMQEFLARGAVSSWSDGEVNFANRVALGSFMSDTFSVQSLEDTVVSVAVLKDYYGLAESIGLTEVNPLNFMEYLYDLSNGVDSIDSMKKFVDRDTVAWKILNSSEFTWQSAGLHALREGGKVFSAMGSVSRALDASNYEHTDRTAWINDPHGVGNYRTSSLRAIDVKPTFWKDFSFYFGITPGKVVEAYSKEDFTRRVKAGLKEFTKRQEKIMRETGIGTATGNIQAAEGIEKLKMLQEFVEKHELDIKLPKDIWKYHYNQQIRYLDKLLNPGDKK